MKDLMEVFLIRHSVQLKLGDNVLTTESNQISNEKIILSVEGEKKAQEISQMDILNDIDVLWSSSYVRAISTAKYIALKNSINLNIDENLNERKLGNLDTLKKLGEGKSNSYTVEQLLDENFKNIDGENRKEVTYRFCNAFNRIVSENQNKKVVIVSHGGCIKFFLLKYCLLNADKNLEYNGKVIHVNSPGVIKLSILNNQIIDITQIV